MDTMNAAEASPNLQKIGAVCRRRLKRFGPFAGKENNSQNDPRRYRKSDAKKICSNMCKKGDDVAYATDPRRSEKEVQNLKKEVGRRANPSPKRKCFAKPPQPRGLVGLSTD